MSTHRSLVSSATPICIIGLLLSSLAQAGPAAGTSPGLRPQATPVKQVPPTQQRGPTADPEPTPTASETSVAAPAKQKEVSSAAQPEPGIPEKKESPQALFVLSTKPSAQPRTPFWNTQRGLGLAFAALGLAGFGLSAWYATQNGQPTGGKECVVGELPNQPCRYNTQDQFAFSFVASNLGLALGIALFTSAHL